LTVLFSCSFLFFFLLLVVAPAVAENITVGRVSLRVGEIGSVNITIDYLWNGLSGYSITVRLSNPEIAEIVAVEFPSWATLKDSSTLPADSVWIKAVDLQERVNLGDSNVVLAILKIRGDNQGKTEINVIVNQMDDDKGNPINVTVSSGYVNVLVLAPTPTVTLAFEVIFAIVAVIAIAYLLRRLKP